MKIALDIDGVIANFAQHFLTAANDHNMSHLFPGTWQEVIRYDFSDHFKGLWVRVKDDLSFWHSIPPCEGVPEGILKTPVAYVTARPIPSDITASWLSRHGCPDAPVYTVGPIDSKVPTLRELGIDVYVEDKLEAFEEINAAGITCYLLDRPWNRGSGAHPLRINSLSEVFAWPMQHLNN